MTGFEALNRVVITTVLALSFLMVRMDLAIAERLVSPSLSPENDKIALSYCKKGEGCYLGYFSINDKIFYQFSKYENQTWISGGFSPDGQEIIFTIREKKQFHTQIASINISTLELRLLTNSKTLKSFPVISNDGKRVLYSAASARRRPPGKTSGRSFDVFELDIESGVERQVTAYRFRGLRSPQYLPDDAGIMISGEYPGITEGLSTYAALYDEHNIQIIPKKSQPELLELRPIFGVAGGLSDYATLSRDGKTLSFLVREKDKETKRFNYDISVFSIDEVDLEERTFRGGKVRRLTRARSYITDPYISPDGTQVVFLSDRNRTREFLLWVIDIDGSSARQMKPKSVVHLQPIYRNTQSR